MNERAVKIRGTKETGGPFRVGDTLTSYQAAMVYSGRHPGGRLVDGTKQFERASIHEHEVFLGKGSPDRPMEWPGDTQRKRALDRQRNSQRKLAWSIYCELRRMVAAGEIKPIKAVYTPSGEIDPRDTVIATAAVAALARRRGDSPEYLAPWMRDPTESRAEKGKTKTAKPAYNEAMRRLMAKWPDRNFPSREEMSDGQIYRLLVEGEKHSPFKIDTLRRVLRDLAPKRQ